MPASPESEAPAGSADATGRAENGTGDGGAASFDANMVVILAALFFALLFAIGLNSLALWCGSRGDAEGGASSSSGVQKRALESIPVEVYGSSGGGEEKAEEEEEVCAICLGEFVDGEKVRVLPRCHHGFHLRCMDAWLLSRGSCPTCRRLVMGGTPAKGDGGGVGQSRR